MEFKGRKVLVMGLGLLGGGIATAKWLVKKGAQVTITDLKPRSVLKDSIRQLGLAVKKINFVLSKHRLEDFRKNDVIVVNPAVSRDSRFLTEARKSGKIITNDARIFFDAVENPIIAVTGTRGKTTTVNWLVHFLRARWPKAGIGGNSSDNPLLALIDKLPAPTRRRGEPDKKNLPAGRQAPVVVELSSWQLELLAGARHAPAIAVITNLFPDHLNRYRSMKDYALAKANIFKNQNRSQFLILNAANPWTKFFEKQNPRSRIRYFSNWQKIVKKHFDADFYGRHNLENFLAAAGAAHLAGVSWPAIFKRIKTLPLVPYRQQTILKKKNLLVINDSAATSPEAVMAALTRFYRFGQIILLGGGTDKNLSFAGWAKAIKKFVRPENLFLLNGSATKKMVRELKKINYFKKQKINLFEDLAGLLKSVRQKVSLKQRIIMLFSPGAASFEKFKNEFDRGQQFNGLVQKLIK